MAANTRGAAGNFTIPGTTTQLSTEVVYCNASNRPGSIVTYRAQVLVRSLPASGIVRVRALRLGGNPLTAADWVTIADLTSVGLSAIYTIMGRPVSVVGVSGGTGGAATADVYFDNTEPG